MNAAKKARPGVVLLEVLIGIAILAMAGTAVLALGHDALSNLHHSMERDREFEQASAFLDAVTLWNRQELDLRMGARRQGRWILTIHRETPHLYEITLADSMRSSLLRTSLYRSVAGGPQ